jgi:hypothetical protein
MRELVIERLKKIKERDGFSNATMRWSNFEFNGVHISNLDLDNLDLVEDADLFALFEKVVKRYYMQM